MWFYKDHGKTLTACITNSIRQLHDSFGSNWRMMEMQAVIGRLQLKKIPEWTGKRNASMALIQAALEK